jgi:hypothetical protein
MSRARPDDFTGDRENRAMRGIVGGEWNAGNIRRYDLSKEVRRFAFLRNPSRTVGCNEKIRFVGIFPQRQQTGDAQHLCSVA